jgi:hypothetical protein
MFRWHIFEEVYIFRAHLPLIYVCIDAAAEFKKQWKSYEKLGLFQRCQKQLILGGADSKRLSNSVSFIFLQNAHGQLPTQPTRFHHLFSSNLI